MCVKILMSDGVVALSTEYYVKALETAGAEVTHGYLQELDLGYDGLLISGGVDVGLLSYSLYIGLCGDQGLCAELFESLERGAEKKECPLHGGLPRLGAYRFL